MSEERITKLLEEIRDLHKLHIEKYDVAVSNQQEAITLQKQAIRRNKIVQAAFFVILALFLAALYLGYR